MKIKELVANPESFCPWCKKMHDAPEFIDPLEKLYAVYQNMQYLPRDMLSDPLRASLDAVEKEHEQ